MMRTLTGSNNTYTLYFGDVPMPSTNTALLALSLVMLAGGDSALAQNESGDPSGQNPLIEFSIDLGSDAELSDPNMDGDEVFDPGDVYFWRGPFFAGPVNGFKDDASIFMGDYAPTPFGAIAPVCVSGQTVQNYVEYFDLDGHDQTDFDIRQYIDGLVPLPQPIPAFPSQCVHTSEFLAISFDDDKGAGWISCDVPVSAPSPFAGLDSYGTTAYQDEIMGIRLTGIAVPATVGSFYGVADERGVHTNLSPNPNMSREHDDDVDSLDAVMNPDSCPYWYFTADHEATGIAGLPLDPGSIYLNTGFGPMQVIDDVAHLGIPESTDIDAFEFAWTQTSSQGLVLTLLFSVDDDDPMTPFVDESGGMDPSMIYASRMTGTSFPYLTEPLGEDIDALTAWRTRFIPTPPCPGNANGDGLVDFNDLNIVLASWGMAVVPGTNGDVNGDGLVDFNDLNIVLANWGVVCG